MRPYFKAKVSPTAERRERVIIILYQAFLGHPELTWLRFP